MKNHDVRSNTKYLLCLTNEFASLLTMNNVVPKEIAFRGFEIAVMNALFIRSLE